MVKKNEKAKQPDIEALQQQVEELTADLQRSRADFANFRRRSDEEKERLMVVAKINVVKQLLPLIDNVERAVGHLPEELKGNQWAEGVVKLQKQLDQALKNIGVEKIPAADQPFNENLHEAVSYNEEGDGVDTVIEELQTGYIIGDDVVRHSMVRVGKR